MIGPCGLTAEWILKQTPDELKREVRWRLFRAVLVSAWWKILAFGLGVFVFGLLVFAGFWLAGLLSEMPGVSPPISPETREIGMFVLAPFGALTCGFTAVSAANMAAEEEHQRQLGHIIDDVYVAKREMQLDVDQNPLR